MTEKNESFNRLKINKPFWETLKSTNKKQNELRASDPIGYLTARQPSGKYEKPAPIFLLKWACFVY